MRGDKTSAVQDADHIRQLMHLDDAAGAVGNAVIIAADRDEPFVADAPFKLEQRVEGGCGLALQIEATPSSEKVST